jgi:hypothetical protein
VRRADEVEEERARLAVERTERATDALEELTRVLAGDVRMMVSVRGESNPSVRM